MKKTRFQVYVDGKMIDQSNKVSIVKRSADLDLSCGGYYAEIKTGNKIYASRFYNTKWK